LRAAPDWRGFGSAQTIQDAHVVERRPSGKPIAFERGRMFAPRWPEAYVDFDQVIAATAMEALRSMES
jgi:hypothetical protein